MNNNSFRYLKLLKDKIKNKSNILLEKFQILKNYSNYSKYPISDLTFIQISKFHVVILITPTYGLSEIMIKIVFKNRQPKFSNIISLMF